MNESKCFKDGGSEVHSGRAARRLDRAVKLDRSYFRGRNGTQCEGRSAE